MKGKVRKQKQMTPICSMLFASLMNSKGFHYLWLLGTWKAYFRRFFIWGKELGFSAEVSCCVVEKAGVNQVCLCLLHTKHSCKTSLGIDDLSATLKRKLEQKKNVPKEMDYEVCIPKRTRQVGQYKSLRCLWNAIQDFSVALFLLWVRMYKMKGQILRSEFSFSQSLATYIADSRKLDSFHFLGIFLRGRLPGDLVRGIWTEILIYSFA